jgi:hypothetical protein
MARSTDFILQRDSQVDRRTRDRGTSSRCHSQLPLDTKRATRKPNPKELENSPAHPTRREETLIITDSSFPIA